MINICEYTPMSSDIYYHYDMIQITNRSRRNGSSGWGPLACQGGARIVGSPEPRHGK